MTRKEWFDSQSAQVQDDFKNNCNKLNRSENFFDSWINYEVGFGCPEDGIQGAFVWCMSPEGNDFWNNLDELFLEEVGA